MGNLIHTLDSLLWGWPLIILLIGTHIFMTIRTGFVQKDIFKAIKISVAKDDDDSGDISQFAALTAALSSTIGTGNIVGVGTAIALGGPGAVFWMWITGILGMATKYAETLIALKYRVKSKDGTMIGGAMYALDRGLHMKWLGIIFAFLTAVCGLGIGCMVQSNSVAQNLQDNFGISPILTAFVLTIIVMLVILNGIQGIAKVAEKLVPFMAAVYIIGCIWILVLNHSYLALTISTILNAAFHPESIAGGFIGASLSTCFRYGFARGLFSNESGMGSAPLIASAAKTKNPKRQAFVSMTATFWDTVVICLITGLVLVSSVIRYPHIDALSGNGALLVSSVFSSLPFLANIILLVGLITFAFSTILGWYYYGERCSVYLFGEKAIKPYKIIWSICVFIGAVVSLDIIWDFADLMNGLMAIPNIIAVLLLHNVIASETKKYNGIHIDDTDTSETVVLDNSNKGVIG